MTSRRPLLPGVLLGVGLGGFLDGIVLHQLLQWHHMVSAEGCCPPNALGGLEENTVADGIFHAVTWLIALIGSVAIWRAWRNGRAAPPSRVLLGALLLGWGIFNALDSVNHFVLELHHVRDDLGRPIGWDVGFLVFALALIGAGWALTRANDELTAQTR